MINKFKIKLLCILALGAVFSTTSNAALTLDATRYIFTGDQVSLSGMVSNESHTEMGAQIWVENSDNKDVKPYFVATPSFFKIAKGKEQVFRIVNVSKDLPQDRETVHWLNLQEIPQLEQGSGISLAIRTKVKLIYRPEALKDERKGAEGRMKIEYLPGESWLVNSTPYVFAIGNVYDAEGNSVTFSARDSDKLSMFMPGDKVKVTGFDIKIIYALNDYGNLESYTINN